jgi:hypothetical protein
MLHSEELHNLYSSQNVTKKTKSRRMRWAGHVIRMGEERRMFKVLMGKPKLTKPLGRQRLKWEDEMRTDLR